MHISFPIDVDRFKESGILLLNWEIFGLALTLVVLIIRTRSVS